MKAYLNDSTNKLNMDTIKEEHFNPYIVKIDPFPLLKMAKFWPKHNKKVQF